MICEYCKPLQYTDWFSGGRGPHKHHENFAALLNSAEDGCELCQGLIQHLERYKHKWDDEDFVIALVKTSKDKPIEKQQFWCALPEYDYGYIDYFEFYQGEKGDEASFAAISTTYVEVEAFVDHGSSMDDVILGRPIQPHSDSESCLELTKAWLKECQSSHSLCPDSNSRQLPKRVIDVGSSLKEPFLYHSGKDEKAPWVTLSHCWGSSRPLTTTFASLQQHGESIPMTTLPPVFRDAVTYTRGLGFRFLWVDCLCIIQDSHEDWAVESTKMHEIYLGASLCIAATFSRGSHDGLFSSGDQLREQFQSFATIPCLGTNENDENPIPCSTISFRRRTDISNSSAFQSEHQKVEHAPLHKRAWVFQESVLSPRRIDFFSSQLVWTCRSAGYCEPLPSYNRLQYLYESSSGSALFAIPLTSTPLASCPDIKSAEPLAIHWWYNAVTNFMKRDITKRADLLPAMAGLAAAIKARSQYTYAAGLWKEDLHRGLLWGTGGSAERPKGECAPTWSWASSVNDSLYYSSDMDTYSADNRAEVVDINIQTEGDKEFAPVIRASLVLKGNFRLLSSTGWEFSETVPGLGSGNYFWIVDLKLAILGLDENHIDFFLDEEDLTPTLLDSLVSRGVICMQIATFVETDHPYEDNLRAFKEKTHCLLLEPCQGAVDTFRRIGVVIMPRGGGMADGWPTRTVTII